MFNETAIEKLVAAELEQATAKYGDKFHSYHEAWAVIQEEVDEAQDELENVVRSIGNAWYGVKHNRDRDIQMMIADTKRFAIKAIAELIQVAAMCEKAARGQG